MGNSIIMLSPRREKKIQKEEDMLIEEQQVKRNELKDKRIKELEGKLELFDKMKEDLDDYTAKLQNIYEKGLINEDGELINNAEMNKMQEE